MSSAQELYNVSQTRFMWGWTLLCFSAGSSFKASAAVMPAVQHNNIYLQTFTTSLPLHLSLWLFVVLLYVFNSVHLDIIANEGNLNDFRSLNKGLNEWIIVFIWPESCYCVFSWIVLITIIIKCRFCPIQSIGSDVRDIITYHISKEQITFILVTITQCVYMCM